MIYEKIICSIADDDLKLKLYKKIDWKKTFVKFIEEDEEDDDLPF